MDGYDVFLNGAVVGRAEVTTEGLYYRFRCRCTLPDQRMYRLVVTTSGRQIDLGICVPYGSISTVDKLMAKKHFKDRNMQFSISIKDTPEDTKSVSVDPNRPFMYIRQLPNARLRIVNNAHEIEMK